MKPTNRNANVSQGEFDDLKDGMRYTMGLFGALIMVLIAMLLLTENKVLQSIVLGFAAVMIVWNVIISYRYEKTK